MDKKSNNSQRSVKKVLILLQSIASWTIYSTLYNLLNTSSKFNVQVILLATIQAGQRDNFEYENNSEQFLKNNNINYLLSLNEQTNEWLDVQTLKPDFVFFTTPYETSHRHELYCLKHISSFAKTCYIPYGIMIAGIENMQFNLPFHHNVDMIFLETELHKKLYLKHCNVRKSILQKKLYVTGYPKFDCLSQIHKNSNQFFKNKNSIKIVWSPHWTLDMFSDFCKTYKYFLNLVQTNKNIEVVLKPHPLMWAELLHKNILSEEELNDFRKISWRYSYK